MKLIWHIFGKDLRRLWVALALWVALLVAKVVLSFSVFAPAAFDAAWFERMQLAHTVLASIETVICFLLAAALVLDDPLVGSTMFWATRPIDGRRLLAAKLLAALLLFFLVPLLMALPWWLACGSGATELQSALKALLLFQTATVVPAIVLACVVERSGRFLQVLLVVLVALLLFTVTKMARPGTFQPRPSITLEQTRLWLGLLGAVVAAAGTIWMQFWTRRATRSVVFLMVMIGLTWWANVAWPWDLARRWGETQSRDLASAEGVQARLNAINLGKTPNSRPRPNAVTLDFEVEGIPSNLSLSSLRAEVVLRWGPADVYRQTAWAGLPSPRYLPAGTLGLPAAAWMHDGETQAHIQEMKQRAADFRRSRGLTAQSLPDTKKAVYSAEMIVTDELMKRIGENPPAFDIVLHLNFTRPEVLAEGPLAVGETTIGRGLRMQVVAERAQEGHFASAKARELVVVSARPPLNTPPMFCIVQRQTGYVSELATRLSSGPTLNAGFGRASLSFEPPKVWRTDHWAPIPGSESAYSIIAVDFRWAGHVQREFHGDRFPFVSAPAK